MPANVATVRAIRRYALVPGSTKIMMSATATDTDAATAVRPPDGHDVGRSEQAGALVVVEHEPVICDGSAEQHDGETGQQHVGQVEDSLGVVQFHEAHAEGEGQEKPEQDLDADAGDPQLLEQFSQVSVDPLGVALWGHGIRYSEALGGHAPKANPRRLGEA